MISVRKKHKLCTERTPTCPFATRIAADTMFFRPRSKSKGRLAQKIAHVEIAPKKYRKKRLLEAGLYMIFNTGTKFRLPYGHKIIILDFFARKSEGATWGSPKSDGTPWGPKNKLRNHWKKL